MLVSYANELQVDVAVLDPHAPRTTAATSALEHGAGIAKIQQWLGHADVATTTVNNVRE
ncbi:MAG: site-specific integrase [Oxalobacteraceae bacterium]|nr:MAG: site-specific integrase [Oxalobacteraceae bacterium]